MLADRRALRPGLTVDAAIDITWALCSLAVYDLLVLDRRWSDDDYQRWLSDTLARELLGTQRASHA